MLAVQFNLINLNFNIQLVPYRFKLYVSLLWNNLHLWLNYIFMYILSIYIALEIFNFQIQYSVLTTNNISCRSFHYLPTSISDLLTFANRFLYPSIIFILFILTRKLVHYNTLNHRKWYPWKSSKYCCLFCIILYYYFRIHLILYRYNMW